MKNTKNTKNNSKKLFGGGAIAAMRRCKWWLIAGACLGIVAGAIYFAARPSYRDNYDTEIYVVKCWFPSDGAYYNLIVDNRRAATAFQNDIESDKTAAIKCEFITHPRADNATLAMYSIMSVLRDSTFAFMEYYPESNYYMVKYYNANDNAVALSCQYLDVRYDCINAVPKSGDCPATTAAAATELGDVCETKHIEMDN
jgi:hypothetical protein